MAIPHAIRSALLPSFLIVTGCFNPDENDERGDPTGTVGTVEDSGSTGVSSTDEDDMTAEGNPTTVDDSSEGETDSGSSTGECTFQGCFCITDRSCGDGLVCRQETCQPLVCGDGVVEGDELCDDENEVDGDGCDADCTYTEIVAVDAAYETTCVLLEGGRVRCWGANYVGQLGQGNTDALGDDEPALEVDDIMLPMPANSITSGDNHSCALVGASDDPVCWGRGNSGQLGQLAVENIGDDEFPSILAPIVVGGPTAQIEAGGSHTCARLVSGTLRCWGGAYAGQLGYGNTNLVGDDEEPSAAGNVPVGSAVDDVSTGVNHTCAVLSNGAVRCWGQGSGGALGYGNLNNIGDDETAEVVAALDFGEDAVAVSCGYVQSCALFESGAVRCWGGNGQGELGQAHVSNIGDDELATTLAPIDLGGTATMLTAGDSHACAMMDDGSVRCWGSNQSGQLGLGDTMNLGDDEVPSVAAALDFGDAQPNQVEAGGSHTCVILDRRRLKCWGYGANGQLGQGTLDNLGDDETLTDVPDVPLFPET
jgi:cysteine-rich repeat protein